MNKAMTMAVAATLSAAARAQTVIDFESFDLRGQEFLDVGASLFFDTPGVNVRLNQGADFRVYDLFRFGGQPNVTGQALIDMNWGTFQNAAGTDILFDRPVSDFSLRAGDFGGDDDSPLRIEAFDAANASLGVASANWPGSAFPPLATLRLAVAGIRRVHYSSGGPFTGSTFIDDIRFTAAECYPDCDTSTGPEVLDIFDFLCFQNRYDAGAPYACDCDQSTGPGVCDIFDFLCFQNAYDAGCP